MSTIIDLNQLSLLTDSELIEFLQLYQQPYAAINTNKPKNLADSANLLQLVLSNNQQITKTLLNLWLSSKLNFTTGQNYTSDQILGLSREQLMPFRQVFNQGLVLSGLPEDFIADDENLVNTIIQILRFKGLLPKPVENVQQPRREIVDGGPANLLAVQIPHFNRVNNIINTRWYAYQDTTPMGGGKTYIIGELARSMQKQNPKISLLVVAPKSVHSKWRKVPKSFGIPVLDVINYETLAGKVGHDLKNPYLTRITTGKSSNYAITPYYDEIVKRGILLTFDENQLVKNKTALRSLASLALIRHIIQLNQRGLSNSRIALLSASPGNNTDHTFSILKMLGVTTNIDVVVDRNPAGLRDVYKFAKNIDARKTEQIVSDLPIDREEALQVAHELYRDVIKPYISSASPMPEIAAGRDYKNGYYRITNKTDIDYVQTGIDILSGLLKRRERKKKKDEEERKKEDTFIGLMTVAMENIEAGKINDLARIANQTLINNPKSKVIIGVNFKLSINRLIGLLAGYQPLILTGDVHSQKTRDDIIDRFQEPNTDSRLLIMITTVGSVGLDLDDKYGQFPRHMFIIPDFHFLTKYQATGRIARADTKSMPTLRFFYGRGAFVEENKLLDSMVKKSGIAKDLLATDNPTPFPGDFDPYVEPN